MNVLAMNVVGKHTSALELKMKQKMYKFCNGFARGFFKFAAFCSEITENVQNTFFTEIFFIEKSSIYKYLYSNVKHKANVQTPEKIPTERSFLTVAVLL